MGSDVLSEAELDPFFDEVARDLFRMEARREYAVGVESDRLRAYLAGEPYDPSAEPAGWYSYIRGKVNAGVAFRKVRVVRTPLSLYERWECEWSYPATERCGQRTFILDLAEAPEPLELPGYDWWMFDERVVLRMHYDDAGGFVGAERLDQATVGAHVGYRDAALAVAVPFPAWWAAHPQDWRDNWLDAGR
jgi:hypothetical protein